MGLILFTSFGHFSISIGYSLMPPSAYVKECFDRFPRDGLEMAMANEKIDKSYFLFMPFYAKL
jgi:hypothetical protein